MYIGMWWYQLTEIVQSMNIWWNITPSTDTNAISGGGQTHVIVNIIKKSFFTALMFPSISYSRLSINFRPNFRLTILLIKKQKPEKGNHIKNLLLFDIMNSQRWMKKKKKNANWRENVRLKIQQEKIKEINKYINKRKEI